MTEQPMLLCYDIREPRRLRRVYRRARRVGLPLQYSVFYLELNKTRLDRLLAEISDVIDHSVDDVRVYGIAGLGDIQQIGQPILPAGVRLSGGSRRRR
jgi:CRISPR-associated protein Cas2